MAAPRKVDSSVTDTSTRQVRRKRVTVFCIAHKDFFTYIYPGCGPYRSVCKKCKKHDPRPYGKH